MDPLLPNPGYLAGLLARALRTGWSHSDPAVRARADARALRLERALAGLLDGSVEAGSRTPAAAPAWATLEVVKGGFATGALLAGGPLGAHEQQLVEAHDLPATRAALNRWHLGESGLGALVAHLESGSFRVEVPEEGALLVVAWLLTHGEAERAADLLGTLVDWFEPLRFYPVPADRPAPATALVHLQSVAELRSALREVRLRPSIAAQNQALTVWGPFEDRLVALVRETIEGPDPEVVLDADGRIAKTARGGPRVVGGTPLLKFPRGWKERARALVAEYVRHGGRKAKSNVARLVDAVEHAVRGAATDWERGVARVTLATIAHKRGLPGSERNLRLRAAQAAVARIPTNPQLAEAVIGRLAACPPDEGLPALEPVSEPVDGVALRPSLVRKIRRALEAPVEDLVALGVIPSGETLARVAPQITAQVVAASVADPSLRRVYEAVYRAFRRRRSLLLLDLQHQVGLDELPWVAAIGPELRAGAGDTEGARRALERLAALALTRFPHVILPNKLLTELGALATRAGLELPLTEELAADIFVGTFTRKFVAAAKVAARLLRGTVYERYYGLAYDQVLALPDAAPPKGLLSRWGTPAGHGEPEFAAMCVALAGGRVPSVAGNGRVIEQQQILTTHNLAVIYAGAGLGPLLTPVAAELAERCLAWVLEQHRRDLPDVHERLIRAKNTAYAWRQMWFFLAVAGPRAPLAFAERAETELAACAPEVQRRLEPAVRGVRWVAEGNRFGPDGTAGGARRFLGWSASGPRWFA